MRVYVCVCVTVCVCVCVCVREKWVTDWIKYRSTNLINYFFNLWGKFVEKQKFQSLFK